MRTSDITKKILLGPGLVLCGVASVSAGTATITASTLHQKISGFGTCTAWVGTLTSAEAALLWDTTTGAGLSLHRTQVSATGTSTDIANLKLANGYGVKIWGSPWTSEYTVQYGTATDGSKMLHLDFNHAQDWANAIGNFVTSVKAAGVPVYAVSSQNEPDGTGDDNYTAAQIVNWVGNYLGPTIAKLAPEVKIMSPETMNWCGFAAYKSAILADANASKYTSIIATHEYGCSPSAYPEIQAAGKEFWETEVYDLGSTTEDPGMGSALRVAGYIHSALTVANMNAWHFWWVKPCATASCGNGALWSQGSNSQPTKRLWVMGNFSRFVRPGFVRVDATAAPTTGVTLTAYRDSSLTKLVVVAINTNTSSTSQSFSLPGITPTKVTPYVTDGTRNLVADAAQTVTSNSFTYSLPSQSVTTLVFNLKATTGLSLHAAKRMGTPFWSAGILTVPGAGDDRFEIVDARGMTRTVELVSGRADIGRIPAGVYQVRPSGRPQEARHLLVF